MSLDNTTLVLKEKELSIAIAEVLTKISTILIESYGPLGKNTIIHKNGDMPVVTKDGLTILRSIKFDERNEYDIYKLIRSVSDGLVDKVGDGSTSAVLSAVSIYNQLTEIVNKYNTTKHFDNSIKNIQELVNDIHSIFLTKRFESLETLEEKIEVLTLIASVSNNNDKLIGREIAKIMAALSPDSIVSVEDNPQDNSESISHKFISGFQSKFYRLVHSVYFNGSNSKNGIILPNGALVVMSYNFTSVHYEYLLENVVKKLEQPRPIIIICETPQKEVVTQIVKDAMISINKNALPQFFLMETGALSGKNSMDTFNDLEAYLGCNASAFNDVMENGDELPSNTIGNAGRVTFYPNMTTSFDNGAGFRNGLDIFNNRFDSIQTELDETPSTQKVSKGTLRNRLNRLNGMNVIIYVGGRTQEEKQMLSYLVEDSVLACKSVMRHGYTLGGNYSTYFAFILLQKIISSNNPKELLRKGIEYHNSFNTTMPLIIDDTVTDINSRLSSLIENDKLSISMINKLVKAYKDVVFIPKTYQNFNMNKIEVISNSEETEYSFNIHNIFTDEAEIFSLDNRINNAKVISPIKTDFEILNASLSIITLLLTSNQYIQ